jgi:hypothetical protein
VTNAASASCNVCNNPCIDVTKTCPASVEIGTTSIPFSGIVTNCGNVPLTNVVVIDDNGTPGNMADDITIVIGNLPVGGSAPYSGTNTIAADSCGPLTDTVVATGSGNCGGNVSSQPKTCTTTITTAPSIAVTKLCTIPSRRPTDYIRRHGPEYRNVTLTNVTAVDSIIGALVLRDCASGTPLTTPVTLAPGQTACYSGSIDPDDGLWKERYEYGYRNR